MLRPKYSSLLGYLAAIFVACSGAHAADGFNGDLHGQVSINGRLVPVRVSIDQKKIEVGSFEYQLNSANENGWLTGTRLVTRKGGKKEHEDLIIIKKHTPSGMQITLKRFWLEPLTLDNAMEAAENCDGNANALLVISSSKKKHKIGNCFTILEWK